MIKTNHESSRYRAFIVKPDHKSLIICKVAVEEVVTVVFGGRQRVNGDGVMQEILLMAVGKESLNGVKPFKR